MKAILRRTRISPKKANLVAGIVRGKKVTDALEILKLMPKKAAKTLYKVVQSAASNAKNNFKQSIDDLYITRLLVTKGPTYRRGIPISRGRTQPIRKRTSHITAEVGLKMPNTKVTADDKKEKSKKSPAQPTLEKRNKNRSPENPPILKTGNKKS
jgi:large subunit ribosomal protein L22